MPPWQRQAATALTNHEDLDPAASTRSGGDKPKAGGKMSTETRRHVDPPERAGSGLGALARAGRLREARTRLLARAPYGFVAALSAYFIARVMVSSGAAFATVAILALAAGAAWWGNRHRALALGCASTAAACMFANILVPQLGHDRGLPLALAAGYAPAYWALDLAALLGAWMIRRHRGNRGVTVLAADAAITAASLLSGYSENAAAAAGFAAMLGVLALRGGAGSALRYRRARLRSGITARAAAPLLRAPTADLDQARRAEAFDPANLARGIDSERRTAAVLDTLDPGEWYVMHSRRLPRTNADLDHLVVGPPGVVMVDTKDWNAVITARTERPSPEADAYQVYALNGSAERLSERLAASAFEASRVAWALRKANQEVHVVIAFTSRTRLPSEHTVVELLDVWDESQRRHWNATLHLTRADAVADVLRQLPAASAPRPGFFRRRLQRRSIPGPERDRLYIQDLAAAADHVFPRA